MPYYASFNPSSTAPFDVLGWYDTDLLDYGGSLPPPERLIQLTQEQWDARQDSRWAVSVGGHLVVADPIPLSAAQRSQIELSIRIGSGITLTSVGTPSLDSTYALDATSQSQISQIGLFANQFGMFPSGGSTQMYPDIDSSFHSFSVANFIAFFLAVASLVSALTTQAGVMASGGVPSWPNQSASIS